MDRRTSRSALVSAGLSGALLLAAAGCDSAAGPETGSAQVMVTTAGADFDLDGYVVSVDAGAARALGVNDTKTFSDLSAGTHSVSLAGVASNCAVSGSNPRPAIINRSDTTSVAFEVSCVATGTAQVLVTTTGADLDPDGYIVSVDGGTGRAIAVNGTMTVSGLSAGTHSVALSAIASNCAVSGANPRLITVARSGTTEVAFQVSCLVVDGPALTAVLLASVPIPPNYGIHDTFVRDGLAFVSAWNSGLMIFDVGNGVRGGTAAAPVLVSRLVTNSNGVAGARVHNSWWFHNPSTGERRYVFIGQEGPYPSGDIHVVDVADLANPVEVAYFHIAGSGPHNFWMDESAQILYAAYYNSGVVALDVSGTLSGNLAGREIARIQPGGSSSTSTWGVQLFGGSLYAIDILSGLWQLRLSGSAFTVLGGGFNLPRDRASSDFWVHGGLAYTGLLRTCEGGCPQGVRRASLYVWRLGASGAPTLIDSIVVGSSGGLDRVTDVEVSDDGKLLMFSDEGGIGLHFYNLADPARPRLLARALVPTGVHTATFAVIGGRRYAFAAKDPPNPALLIYDVTDLKP